MAGAAGLKDELYAYLRLQLIQTYQAALFETVVYQAEKPESSTAEIVRERSGPARLYRPGREGLPPRPHLRIGEEAILRVDSKDLPPALSDMIRLAFASQADRLDGRHQHDDQLSWQGRSAMRALRGKLENEVRRGELPASVPRLFDTAAELAQSNRRVGWKRVFERISEIDGHPPFRPGA